MGEMSWIKQRRQFVENDRDWGDDSALWWQWRIVDPLTINEAANLLAGFNPNFEHKSKPEDAAKIQTMRTALLRAANVGRLPLQKSLAYLDGSYDSCLAPCEASHPDLAGASMASAQDLGRWADSHSILHGWNLDELKDMIEAQPPTINLARYPAELRAAIEAFEAVSKDPSATIGISPRQALLHWLDSHRPELGSNARERIVTVANWAPAGGAPKTPGT